MYAFRNTANTTIHSCICAYGATVPSFCIYLAIYAITVFLPQFDSRRARLCFLASSGCYCRRPQLLFEPNFMCLRPVTVKKIKKFVLSHSKRQISRSTRQAVFTCFLCPIHPPVRIVHSLNVTIMQRTMVFLLHLHPAQLQYALSY